VSTWGENKVDGRPLQYIFLVVENHTADPYGFGSPCTDIDVGFKVAVFIHVVSMVVAET